MGQFTADLTTFCKTTAPERVAAVVRGTIMEIGARVVEASPVGNPSLWKWGETLKQLGWVTDGYVGGRFRANWQYGFGTPPEGTLNTIDKSGGATRGKLDAGVLSSPVAGVHYIVNNLPYAQALENGHSTQAPTGMVGLTMLEVPGIIEEMQR